MNRDKTRIIGQNLQKGVSITTVSRLLKRAKDEKIIEFVIRDPYVECIVMEQQLKERFGLQEMIIAPAFRMLEEAMEENPKRDEMLVKKLVALETPEDFWQGTVPVNFIGRSPALPVGK